MSHARAAAPPVTIAEFDAFVEAQPEDGTLWQLIDGEIVGMTNPNVRHGQVAVNIAVALKPVAEEHGCRVNIGGLRVQASSDLSGVDKTVPDITVQCGALSDVATWIDDPAIIIEILSPSTMDFDRGAKLAFYKSLVSAADIIIVYQDQIRVEHYRRADDGWVITALTLATDQLELTGLAFAMPLSAIYAGTALQR